MNEWPMTQIMQCFQIKIEWCIISKAYQHIDNHLNSNNGYNLCYSIVTEPHSTNLNGPLRFMKWSFFRQFIHNGCRSNVYHEWNCVFIEQIFDMWNVRSWSEFLLWDSKMKKNFPAQSLRNSAVELALSYRLYLLGIVSPHL